MSRQNIYDNPSFFEEYESLRLRPGNANDLIVNPELLSLLPDLMGKSVIDLGCGAGDLVKDCLDRGAETVLGVDISERMIRKAQETGHDGRAEFRVLPLEDLDSLEGAFDLAVSSLAFHYVRDFSGIFPGYPPAELPAGALPEGIIGSVTQ